GKRNLMATNTPNNELTDFLSAEDLELVNRFFLENTQPLSMISPSHGTSKGKGKEVVDEVGSSHEVQSTVVEVGSSHVPDLNNLEEEGVGEDEGLKGSFFPWFERCSSWFTPNGIRYSSPIVPECDKPKVMTTFRQWEQVVDFYEAYAKKCGFSTRLGTMKRKNGSITHRESTFKVCDCKASIRVKFCEKTASWDIYHFEEPHNHMIVPTYNRDLIKLGRRLDFSTKEFIHRVSMNKVGATVAHKIQSIRPFIGERDSQLMIEKLNDRVKNLPNFFFKYSLVNGELRGGNLAAAAFDLPGRATGCPALLQGTSLPLSLDTKSDSLDVGNVDATHNFTYTVTTNVGASEPILTLHFPSSLDLISQHNTPSHYTGIRVSFQKVKAEIMGRGVSSGGGQSSLNYLFGSGEEPKPTTASKGNAEAPPSQDRPSTKVHAAPGGGSSLGYLFGDGMFVVGLDP
ncbi:hypothetical protein M8C21_013195, partial [Ambrosia artemisiifolia]